MVQDRIYSGNGSAACLGVRLCKRMAGVRSLPTHIHAGKRTEHNAWNKTEYLVTQRINGHYSSASRGCHTVLQKLRPTRKRAGCGNYSTLYIWNEEHPYRAPKAANVDHQSSGVYVRINRHHVSFSHCEYIYDMQAIYTAERNALVMVITTPLSYAKSRARDTNVPCACAITKEAR